MTEPTGVDARIAAFFATPQADLPDRAFDAVRRDIHAARQRRVLVGQWRFALRVGVAAVGAVAVLAIVAFGIASLPTTGPGSSPSQQANPTSSALLSPAVPTQYTSTLYGYTLTLPAGWSITPASQA